MKRFAVVGKNRKLAAALAGKMKNLGFVFDKARPEFVVSLGGDGTLLHAERLYPGVPKLLSRDSANCQMCGNMPVGAVLKRIMAARHRVKEYKKIEAAVGKKRLAATNDIIIRNSFPGHAIRFTVSANRKKAKGVLIGDGIVVATPFGSTAYFKSITGRSFSSGIGVAFNNLTVRRKHLLLGANSRVVLKLLRGSAVVVADNNPKFLAISQGKSVVVKQGGKATKIITI